MSASTVAESIASAGPVIVTCPGSAGPVIESPGRYTAPGKAAAVAASETLRAVAGRNCHDDANADHPYSHRGITLVAVEVRGRRRGGRPQRDHAWQGSR